MGFDFRQIAEGARAFFDVGKIYIDSPKKNSGVAAIPYYVDTAFACELFMKAIIVFQNPNITKKEFQQIKHRLDKLFYRLSPETQEKIKVKIPDCQIQKVQAEYVIQAQKILSSGAPDDVKRLVKYKIENPVSSFEEMLKQQANLFEDWRYYYEVSDGAPIFCDEWFLYQFCTELHNIMVKIMNME